MNIHPGHREFVRRAAIEDGSGGIEDSAGFGIGCTTWTPAAARGASGPDLLFALSGALVPVELQSITID